MRKWKLLGSAGAVLSAACLCACVQDGPQIQGQNLAPLKNGGAAQLGLGVTYKADGKVWPAASDALYQSLSGALDNRGGWNVSRLGSGADDFAPVIAAIAASAGAGRAPSPSQRLLVLVENHTDHSATSRVARFISGMPFGATYRADPASNHYDITIAYRDAAGPDHVRHVHQDLLFLSRASLFGERGGSSLQAFNRIVSSSLDGSRAEDAVAAARQPLQVAQRAP